MEFIEAYNLSGLAIGIITFLIIGLFHPIVIKTEYYFGTRCWWVFLLAGVCGIVGSMLVENILCSVSLGGFAFSSFWGIGELFDQKKRVEKGWFPANPKKKEKTR